MEFNKLVSTKDIGLLIKTTRKAQGVTQEPPLRKPAPHHRSP